MDSVQARSPAARFGVERGIFFKGECGDSCVYWFELDVYKHFYLLSNQVGPTAGWKSLLSKAIAVGFQIARILSETSGGPKVIDKCTVRNPWSWWQIALYERSGWTSRLELTICISTTVITRIRRHAGGAAEDRWKTGPPTREPLAGTNLLP